MTGERFFRRATPLILGLLLLPLVTGVKHVDIFQQFQDGSYDERQKAADELGELEGDGDAIQTEQPTSCVEEVLPSDPLELPEKLEQQGAPPAVAVQNLPTPNVGELFRKLATGLFNINLLQMGQRARKVLGDARSQIGAYVNDTVAKFEQQRYRMVSAVRTKLDQVNQSVRKRFDAEFVEYKDVCLPDTDKCMKLMHTQIEQYEQRLRSNMEQCSDRLAEELAQQREKVDQAQQLMDGPYHKIDRCLDRDAGFGRSILACTGAATSNLAKMVTQSLRSFTATIGKLSGGFERRMDKYDKCVVDRRRLVEQNERKVAASVKGCFEKRRSVPDNFFEP